MGNIFKSYDIRGLYPSELNEDVAYKIGRAFVKFLKCRSVVVGRDMRISSPKLFEAIARGINDEGADVIDIGMCSTPQLYFCVGFYKYDASIMITASHNPGIYNGFKMTRESAIPISGATGIEEIKKLAESDFNDMESKGKIVAKNFMADYIKHVMLFSDIRKKFKVVIDYANGMGSYEADNVLSNLNLDIIEMYKQPDGNFPNHEANPLKEETLQALKKKIIDEKADLGIAFDGDCDRVGFVDDEGVYIPGDLMTALLSKIVLERNPCATILYDLRSSRITKETIEKYGGKAIKCRVGHAFIKAEIRQHNAAFAGELSSHYYYKENFCAESSIISILTVLSLLSETGRKMSELVRPLRKYFHSGEINFEVEDKDGKMKELAEIYKDGNVSWLDGISVEYKDWWFNVRASNTEPLLRLNLESDAKELMEKKVKEISEIIEGVKG